MIFKTFWRKKEKVNDIKSDKVSNISDFKYKTTIETRFSDFDMMGHVNNAVYFTYMEIARTKYWKQAINWNWEQTGVVVANAGINYKVPIFLKDQISMYVRTSRIGQTSFDLEYIIVKLINGEDVICSRGKTTCVAFDYKTKKSIQIPSRERSKMLEFEQLI